MFSSALKSFSSNITSNYTLSANPTTHAGAWKVFEGKSKKSDKVVSVFIFDRKTLDSAGGSFDNRSTAASRKKINDEVVERLKKEASSLARLRHPNILELAEPVEDTRGGGLMFATEPITATLAGLLTSQDNQESRRGRKTRSQQGEEGEGNGLEIDELEIQKGLLQIAKGLEFLHESAGLVHGNLTPEAIYINQKSDWKISGLAFAGSPDSPSSSTPSSGPPIALSELLYFDPRLPRSVQLDLNYTSPDFAMDTNISTGADMFSLGLVILALYNSPHESPLHTNNNIATYKKLFSSSSTVPSSNNNYLSSKPLPRDLSAEVLPRLITRRATQRMTAREFQSSAFFDNILVSTIRFLDSLPGKTPNEKSQFMRGLPRILDQFPKSVLQKKVLPALLEETKDKDLLSLILTDVFKIIEILPSAQRFFVDRVLPKLREVFSPPPKGAIQERDTAKEAGLAIVLDNMKLIAENCSGKEFKADILPIIQQGLESPTHSLVDKSLRCLSIILTVLDFSTIKNEVFPIVATVFSKTSSLAIKVRGLEAFVVLCGGTNEGENGAISKANSSTILDKYTVQEKVVPLLKVIKTKEPAVMMAALNVFKHVGKIADIEFLATEVLPILWNFSLGPLLNLSQFQQYMDLVKSLSARIEQEQTRKLQELSSNSSNGFDHASRSDDLMSMSTSSAPQGSVGEDDFARLVLGKGSSSDNMSNSTPSLSNTAFGSRQGSESHDFGWNASLRPSMQQALQSQQPSSRAITPDHALSSFTPMSPSNLSNRPAIQPQSSFSAASNPWATPLQPQSTTPSSNSSAWAAQSNSTSGWSLPPPVPNNGAGSSSSGMAQQGQLRTQNFPTTNSGFTMPPPPQQQKPLQPIMGHMQGSNNMTLGMLGQMQARGHQPQGGSGTNANKKSGLDAYESLI